MYDVAAYYLFTPLADPAGLVDDLRADLDALGARGTLLLAAEGINGTLAAPAGRIEAVVARLRAIPGCGALAPKYSTSEEAPFAKLKVRLKREIVTMGVPGVDPVASVGRYVPPADWNALIEQDDVVLIDTRNTYETAIGTFEGAIDPQIETFRAFPEWWRANAERFEGKRVAMFCTGGIRCEKSTNFLISEGVEEVFHLQGGILKYLEDVPEPDSLWNGACFVFDERVSVEHGLATGPHELCRACRGPVAPEDKLRAEYEEGVSCHRCHNRTSAEDKARFRERQRQIKLAEARGAPHMGAVTG